MRVVEYLEYDVGDIALREKYAKGSDQLVEVTSWHGICSHLRIEDSFAHLPVYEIHRLCMPCVQTMVRARWAGTLTRGLW